jgi:hypothetical protein
MDLDSDNTGYTVTAMYNRKITKRLEAKIHAAFKECGVRLCYGNVLPMVVSDGGGILQEGDIISGTCTDVDWITTEDGETQLEIHCEELRNAISLTEKLRELGMHVLAGQAGYEAMIEDLTSDQAAFFLAAIDLSLTVPNEEEIPDFSSLLKAFTYYAAAEERHAVEYLLEHDAITTNDLRSVVSFLDARDSVRAGKLIAESVRH